MSEGGKFFQTGSSWHCILLGITKVHVPVISEVGPQNQSYLEYATMG